MAEDFSGLEAAIDVLITEVTEAIADFGQMVSAENQPKIDALAAKVAAAGAALKTALPVAETPAPSDGTGSTDVTP
jgi:hypothetical protein